jgi:hypothetical protein
MNSKKKYIILVLMLFACSYKILCQVSSTISNIGVEAKVIAPITGINSNSLDFGTLTRSSSSGSVTIYFSESDVSISTSGGVSVLTSSTYSAAFFEITGENNAQYTITLPADNDVKLTRAGGSEQMTVTGFNHNSDLMLSDTGADSFSVGATLNVGADQVAGEYSGSFNVTVLYQ